MKRRSFLRGLGASGALIPVSGYVANASGQAVDHRDDVFTFVHLTDSHVQRRRSGHEGWQACVDSVNRLSPQPALAMMGGDMVFDGLYTDKEVYLDQIELFKAGAASLQMPWYPCMGNHDVFGLSSRRKTTPDDPDIGKGLIQRHLQWEHPYYSFNHGGWHFVVLDTIHEVDAPHGRSYKPMIGEEQLTWLRFDLGAHAEMPTVVVMHIAAFCHAPQLSGNLEMKAYNGLVVEDNLALREIFERHGVKLVLQGHTHQNEDFCYNGVWYVTSQSVSAAWWGGNWRGFSPGYLVCTAHPSGEITWRRETFAWEHRLEPEDTLEREKIAQRGAYTAEQRRLYEEEVMGRR